jgi:hypothetical protein
LMTVCTLSITLLMVYGTIRGKATHLLPFFCLQLFDFAITTIFHPFSSNFNCINSNRIYQALHVLPQEVARKFSGLE